MRFVKVEYTGREKDTGKVFDTTKKDVAEKADLNIKRRFFGAAPLILGDGMLIKGFEKALNSMKKGEEKTIVIPPEEAYGPRNADLVKLVSINIFKNSGQKPYPGMICFFENGMPAKVQSVSGGRVRLDFNHELAGKTLEFDLKFVDEVSGKEEVIKFLFELLFPGYDSSKLKFELDKDGITLSLPKELTRLQDFQHRKLSLIEKLKKYADLKTVKFNEEY